MKTETEFISGVLYAVQELILIWDQPTMAEEIMRSAGSEHDFIKAQKANGFETRKMNKVIRKAFNSLK